jgi:predicted CXXCH cytochrome family protein
MPENRLPPDPSRPCLPLFALLLLSALSACVFSPSLIAAPGASDAEPVKMIPNRRCLKCHNDEDDKTSERDDGTIVNIFIDADSFAHSVHGEQPCMGCHNSIKKAKHETPLPKSIGCVECHMKTWEQQQGEDDPKYKRLDVVLAQIDSYMNSVHARPNLMDQSNTNATCYDCHDAHRIGTIGSAARAEYRKNNPEICGRCHSQQREAYATSVHGHQAPSPAERVSGAAEGQGSGQSPGQSLGQSLGQSMGRASGQASAEGFSLIAAATAAVSEDATEDSAQAQADGAHRMSAAVCSDCHTPHSIDSPDKDPVKLMITENCGTCHEQQVRTYEASYHGQVVRAGYAYTAKCYDCHGSHGIMDVDDPASKVHPNNRLETCRQCHENAPEGFLGFHAHGDANDFENYPEMWIARRFMDALIIGVFAFFWTHMLLWIFREWRDRRQGKGYRPDPAKPATVYFRRFSLGWRLAHVLLAVAVMLLVLTGTAVLFSGQPWAQYIIGVLGGPRTAATIHRAAALTFIAVFVGHLVVVAWNITRARGKFQWLGPTSMVPNLQDIKDIGRMFKWFFGLAPRPDFDRWSYWEKFDYWAPFWGMFIIGLSGLMLWFPTQTASVLPGWVFNIATIVHAEEAILAAVFLFTVHYFNVHFRPDKFPMDTVMATGAVPLEEFKHEHRLEYERLEASGELSKYLVKPPSERATRSGRKITGWLIVIGLVLAGLVLNGYFEQLASH